MPQAQIHALGPQAQIRRIIEMVVLSKPSRCAVGVFKALGQTGVPVRVQRPFQLGFKVVHVRPG